MEKPFHDIDLCVIADKDADRAVMLSHSSKKIDISIFPELPLGMRFRVLMGRQLLFLRDELKLHRTIVATIMSYLDFKPRILRRTERVPGGEMFDPERLTKIISDIYRYPDDPERMELADTHDLDDIRNFYAVSMILFTLINRVIDLGDLIVTSRNLWSFRDYREIFNLPERGTITDKELASDLSNPVYQRNVLSHEYNNRTEKDVFRTYRRVHVIRKFVERVKEYIKDA